MRVELENIIDPLLRAQTSWKAAPLTGDKYVYFDIMAKDVYGLKLCYAVDSPVRWQKQLTHAEVIDEQKYTMFLLKWA